MWILLLIAFCVLTFAGIVFWCPAFKRRHIKMYFKVLFVAFSIEAED